MRQPALQHRRDVVPPLGVAGHLLHGDQPNALGVGGIEAAVDRVVLLEERIEGQHDDVAKASVGGVLDLLGLEPVVRGGGQTAPCRSS